MKYLCELPRPWRLDAEPLTVGASAYFTLREDYEAKTRVLLSVILSFAEVRT
jgi:hypothetical protein